MSTGLDTKVPWLQAHPEPAGKRIGTNGDGHKAQGKGLQLPANLNQPGPDPGLPTCEPVIVTLSDVQPTAVEWLWGGRFAIGKLTLIAGDPGLGKSCITLDMAARVSTGTPWPDKLDGLNPAGSVVLLSAEDDLGDTIRPRLDAAGADVTRIKALQAVRRSDPKTGETWEAPFCLSNIQILETVCRQTPDLRLVIIDPVSAFLGDTDSHKNAEVRGILAPLSKLAADFRAAVVVVTHLNKSGAGPALYRAMGSLAFTAAARAAWAVCKDKDDDRRRLLLPVKNNLAPDVEGLAYTIQPSTSNPSVGIVAWEAGAVGMHADEALSDGKGQDRSERDEAREWLADVLKAGPVLASDIKNMANGAGVAYATLRRAKGELGVTYKREGFGKECKTYWTLPDHTCSDTPYSKKVSMCVCGEQVWEGKPHRCSHVPTDAHLLGDEQLLRNCDSEEEDRQWYSE